MESSTGRMYEGREQTRKRRRKDIFMQIDK